MSKKTSRNKLQSIRSKNEYLKTEPFILKILSDGEIHYKEEICNKLGLCERKTRIEIAKAKLFFPVISFSSRKGYRLIDTERLIAENNKEEISQSLEEINHTLRENKSRIKKLNRNMRALIATKRVILKEGIRKGLYYDTNN